MCRRDIHELQKRYLNDFIFNRMVDNMTHALMKGDITVSSMLDTVYLACVKYTERQIAEIDRSTRDELITPQKLQKESRVPLST